MSALVLATYDLGRPPSALVQRMRVLGETVPVVVVDLAVDPWPTESLSLASVVVVWAEMHTAAVLAQEVVLRVRRERPDIAVALSGLAAGLPRVAASFDAVFGPENRAELERWVIDRTVAEEMATSPIQLAPLNKYARLQYRGEERLAGAVATTRGCLHRCRHCPVPVAYGGRIRLEPVDTVLGLVEEQVAMGARHITFADPDFLNAPSHARRIVASMRNRHGGLSWDATVKVEHVLRDRTIWAELAGEGCLFVTSAFESMDDETLGMLDKGHTAAQANEAVQVLRSAGIDVRPTWMPFLPTSRPSHVAAIFDFVAQNDLIGSVDPVQYGIRLLVPAGSLLIDHPAIQPHLRAYDPERDLFLWDAIDPVMDDLQQRLAEVAERGAMSGESTLDTFVALRGLVDAAVGREPVGAGLAYASINHGSIEGRPRMSEPWFC